MLLDCMTPHSRGYTGKVLLLVVFLHFPFTARSEEVQSVTPAGPEDSDEKKAKEPKELRIKNILRVYWQDGLHLDSLSERLRMRVGGELQLEAGLFNLDDE